MTKIHATINGHRFSVDDTRLVTAVTIPVSGNRRTVAVRLEVLVNELPGEMIQVVEKVVYQPTPPNPEDAIDVILKAIGESGDKSEAVRFWMTAITNQLTAILRDEDDS